MYLISWFDIAHTHTHTYKFPLQWSRGNTVRVRSKQINMVNFII